MGLKKGQPKRSLLDSFEMKVEKSEGCWEWKAKISKKTGYGQIGYLGKHYLAHRVSYMLYRGAIQDGLVIDHLCRNRWCVNPNHLEVVTIRENTLRGVGFAAVNAKKTHCIHGHPLSGDNLYISPKGSRECRICRYDAVKRNKLSEVHFG